MSIVGTRPPLISETNLYEPRHKASIIRLLLNVCFGVNGIGKSILV